MDEDQGGLAMVMDRFPEKREVRPLMNRADICKANSNAEVELSKTVEENGFRPAAVT